MPRLTTKELTKQTWPDYVRFFSQGNGWDHCGCIAYHGLRAPKDVRLWTAKRDWALAIKQEKVEQRRTHGVLVYGGGDPVGWCQFGGPGEFAYRDTGPDAPWRITCFCTAPAWRGKGVSVVALRAAVQSIARREGRVIEARAVAAAPPDHVGLAEMKEWQRQMTRLLKEHGSGSDVVKRHQLAQPRVTMDVRGVGEVDAWDRSTGTFFHGGSVSMFEAEGFEATRVIQRTNKIGVPQPSFVGMCKEF